MKQVTYTQESFQEVLQEAYDLLQPYEIENLLLEAKEYLMEENLQNKFILSICLSVAERRNISFKQWKAISAYVSGKRREENNKNNKSF